MNYSICKNKIIVECEEFCPKEILECGQVFSYKKIEDFYFVYPGENLAVIYKENGKYIIEVLNGNLEFFINYFDLETDYGKIKEEIKKFSFKEFDKKLILKTLEFGSGIRILKQEIFETLISFIFSANNNIKRFTNSLNTLRRENGKEIVARKSDNVEVQKILETEKFWSFPNIFTMRKLDEKYFKKIGAGYRAEYLADTIKNIDLKNFSNLECLETDKVLDELLKFKGVGRKVGECVLLFSLGRLDVFPVDTWIEKVFFEMTKEKTKISREKISKQLINKFGKFSGYLQQYLFYYKREIK